MRLKDKVAIVTGSASGFGRGAALRFAREGAKVAGADIDDTGGCKTADEVRSAGGESIFIHADVTRAEQVRNLVEQTVRAYGGVDVLFNNVGVCLGHTLLDVSEEEWDRVMAINLKSMFLCCKYAIPEMLKRGKGSIVLTSSANGIMAEPCLATYCATKAGILGLTRSIATDYGKYNIRCNAVCPTYTRTPPLEAWVNSGVDPNLSWDKLDRMHALNRLSQVDEVVNCVLFLASDESSIVTGSAMVIDGGLTMFKLA